MNKKTFFLIILFELVFSVLYANYQRVNRSSLVIQIEPVFSGRKLTLGTSKYVTAVGDTLQIDVLRFYLSGFVLKYSDGRSFIVKNKYFLIDAEIGSSMTITLDKIPTGNIVGLSFNIGVDSIKSVSGVHDGALDPANGMYWSWNSGYINAKLEGRSKSCQTFRNGFEFHIGGFSSPYNTIRKVDLDFNATSGNIKMYADVACWFDGISLRNENEIMTPGAKSVLMANKFSKMFSIITLP